MKPWMGWAPAVILGVGAVFGTGISLQRAMPLRAPLASAIPAALDGFTGRDIRLADAEAQVAGVSDYLLRDYSVSDSASTAFSVYVGYYESQTQGRTIHSPKNCLPGAGWEALASTVAEVPGPSGPVTVNRYMLQRGTLRAVVLYWYQGRGRVEANEYRVKWHLLWDAAVTQRSDEALVRIVVPFERDEDAAVALAERVAATILPAVDAALPAG